MDPTTSWKDLGGSWQESQELWNVFQTVLGSERIRNHLPESWTTVTRILRLHVRVLTHPQGAIAGSPEEISILSRFFRYKRRGRAICSNSKSPALPPSQGSAKILPNYSSLSLCSKFGILGRMFRRILEGILERMFGRRFRRILGRILRRIFGRRFGRRLRDGDNWGQLRARLRSLEVLWTRERWED